MLKELISKFTGNYPVEQHGELTRKRIADAMILPGSYRTGAPAIYGVTYDYWCKCGTKLTDGPRGGLSVNAVCEKCKINYGCLAGYHGE